VFEIFRKKLREPVVFGVRPHAHIVPGKLIGRGPTQCGAHQVFITVARVESLFKDPNTKDEFAVSGKASRECRYGNGFERFEVKLPGSMVDVD
jgi:hypothetical protein